MTRIERTARIHEAHGDVIARLQDFFSQRPKLRVRALGSSTAEVEVRYSLLYDWTKITPPRGGMAFAWRPGWRGFPSFGATLTVRPVGEETNLVLEGSYEPPGGVMGALFDRVVGQKLAARTMDALLDQLARNVEGSDQVHSKP
jgi:Polyketide cyclase / dehydrase and lipid transport